MTADEAIELVLARALKDDGVHETGPNDGPEIRAMLSRVHWNKQASWCAAAVGFWGSEALGSAWPLPLVPGTWTLHDFAKKQGWLTRTPRRGMVFLLYGAVRKSWHTGLVVDVLADGTVNTIEGNTNQAGAHDGDGVYQKNRRFGAQDWFIDWTLGLT